MKSTNPILADRQKHLFVSSADGFLSDTRIRDWHKKPLRENYCQTHGQIRSLADVKATLRAGEYAWPGGYPMFLVTSDGAALCFDCARKEFRQIVWDYQNNASTGWRVEGCGINWEEKDLICDHCNERIQSAYGEEKAKG